MSIFRWLYSQPYLLLTLAALCWGGNAIAGKIAVGHISPFLLTSFRWLLAVAIVLPFALPHLKREWPIVKRNLPFLFALGTFGFAIFNNLMYLSLNYTTAINVSIVQASMPFIVFLLNFFLFAISATGLQLFGFMLTLIGVTLVTANGSLQNLIELEFNFGDIIMIIAIMTYGVYSVFLHKKPSIHWLSMISVLACAALIMSIPFAGYEIITQTAIWPDLEGIAVIVYTAIFAAIIAQICWIRGLEMLGSNAGGVFVNFVPVVGSALAIILLGEKFHLYHGLAMVLVIGGVWLAQQNAAKLNAFRRKV